MSDSKDEKSEDQRHKADLWVAKLAGFKEFPSDKDKYEKRIREAEEKDRQAQMYEIDRAQVEGKETDEQKVRG